MLLGGEMEKKGVTERSILASRLQDQMFPPDGKIDGLPPEAFEAEVF